MKIISNIVKAAAGLAAVLGLTGCHQAEVKTDEPANTGDSVTQQGEAAPVQENTEAVPGEETQPAAEPKADEPTVEEMHQVREPDPPVAVYGPPSWFGQPDPDEEPPKPDEEN